jgi:hypothetical protein
VVAGAPAGRCLLHAHALAIASRVFVAPLPPDLARVFEADGIRPPEGPP